MNKTIFITGCDSGIGEATADYFLKKGWQVVATYKTEPPVCASNSLLALQLDVTDMASVFDCRDKAIQRFGRIDVVVNNAGYGLVGVFEDISANQIQEQFDVNLFGIMNVSRAFLPHLRGSGGGTIVNISSMFGRISMPFFSIYTASKWAVEGFSEALIQEVEEYNIRVKLIEPGTIKTNFFKNVVRVPSVAKAYEKRYTNFIDKILIKGERGESPVMVAERVYKAATTINGFRYLVDFTSKLLVTMHIINPFFIFKKIIKKAIG